MDCPPEFILRPRFVDRGAGKGKKGVMLSA
jgi:hypothetical protein